MPLLLATNNLHKITELTAILGGGIRLLTPAELSLDLEVDESGNEYEINARLKAQAWASLAGLPALADDSGLEVSALGGEPGVHSSRWLAPRPQAEKNLELIRLLAALGPEAGRAARFVCVACLALPDGRFAIVRGECPGTIAHAPSGGQGFGYDPVFTVAEMPGRTMAELPAEVKNRLSHRARAVQAMRTHPLWREMLEQKYPPALLGTALTPAPLPFRERGSYPSPRRGEG
jgi:XTP/dITP diphosphohydrolase